MPRNEDYNDKFMNLCDWNFSDANTINLLFFTLSI